MGVVFVMPAWSGPSELWLQRMLEELEPYLVAVAARRPDEDAWRGKIPAVTLEDRSWSGRHLRPHLGRFHDEHAHARRVLRGVIESPEVTAVLVHYLDFAMAFRELWETTTKPVFVHCHGRDVTWELRDAETPEAPVFPPDYPERVVRLSSCTTLIANSEATRRRLTAIGVPPERIRLKYLGVPVPDAPPPHPPRSRGLEVLYLGRLVDFKGPDLLLRAFEAACAQGLDARLTFAGDGPLRAELETLVRQSPQADRIELLGWIDAHQGEELRRRADIFSAHNCRGPVTHQEEAFGVAFVEGMAAALPVVSGRSGSLPETVVDGETGMLVEPGDVAGHAAALLALGADPALRRRLGEAGWRRARNHFSMAREREALQTILGLSQVSA